MNAIVDLCVVPLGVGVSLSKYVAACERVLQDAGLGKGQAGCASKAQRGRDRPYSHRVHSASRLE